MSTSVTTANGVVVVTQVFPLEEKSDIPVPNVVVAPVYQQVPSAQLKVSEMTRLFLRGEPKSLGIVQIFIGLVMVVLGLVTYVTSTFHGEIPIGLGIACIIAGSLSVAAHKGTCAGLIIGTLATHIISGLLAIAGIGYFCMELSIRPGESGCKRARGNDGYYDCDWMVVRFNNLMDGVKSLLLILAVLEACVSISISVFSGRATRHRHAIPAPKLPTETDGVESLCDSEVALLNSVGDALTPPAYEP